MGVLTLPLVDGANRPIDVLYDVPREKSKRSSCSVKVQNASVASPQNSDISLCFTVFAFLSNMNRIQGTAKILLFPVAAVFLFQLGKHVEKRSLPMPPLFPEKPPFSYQYLAPTIKVGSYHDFDEKLGVRRISAISIKEENVLTSQMPGAEIEITGSSLFLSGGERTKKVSDKRFILPPNSRALKSEIYSMFEFVYDHDYFSFLAVSVYHINIPAQEVTLAVCSIQYTKRS